MPNQRMNLLLFGSLSFLIAVILMTSTLSVSHAQSDGTPEPDEADTSPIDLISGTWETLETIMLTPRSEMRPVVIDGLIYVAGGIGRRAADTQKLEVYDPASDEWTALAPMPEGRHHTQTTVHARKLYVLGGYAAGGFNGTDTAFRYDPDTDTWETLASLPETRGGGEAVTLGDYIYIVGGVGPSPRPRTLRYDPATDTWDELATTLLPRDHLAAVALDGKIYAMGGRAPGRDLASVEVYDPELNVWSAAPPMNEAHSGFGAAILHGQIIVAAGETFAGGVDTLKIVEVFDPEVGEWVYAPDMPFVLHGTQIVVVDSDVYVVGGSSAGARAINDGRIAVYRLD